MRCFSAAVLLPILLLLSTVHGKSDGLFTYSSGVFTTINVPSVYIGSRFGGINDAGEIVGTNDNTYVLQGLLYSGGAFSTFDYPGQSPYDE